MNVLIQMNNRNNNQLLLPKLFYSTLYNTHLSFLFTILFTVISFESNNFITLLCNFVLFFS